MEGASAKALYDYTSEDERLLSFSAGAVFTLISNLTDNWWFVRGADGVEGFVPCNFLEVDPSIVAPETNDAVAPKHEVERECSLDSWDLQFADGDDGENEGTTTAVPTVINKECDELETSYTNIPSVVDEQRAPSGEELTREFSQDSWDRMFDDETETECNPVEAVAESTPAKEEIVGSEENKKVKNKKRLLPWVTKRKGGKNGPQNYDHVEKQVSTDSALASSCDNVLDETNTIALSTESKHKKNAFKSLLLKKKHSSKTENKENESADKVEAPEPDVQSDKKKRSNSYGTLFSTVKAPKPKVPQRRMTAPDLAVCADVTPKTFVKDQRFQAELQAVVRRRV
eukprot:Colp12_sorted_trinity150504_noHs@21613